MRSMKKAALAFVVVCAAVLCTVLSAANISAAEVVDSGDWGDNLTWILYDDGELVIEGEGEMREEESYDYPWSDFRNSITSLTIGNSVTTIGNSAFSYCTKLAGITIPNSVTSIGYSAFSGCSSLTSIIVDPDNPNYCNDEYGVLFNKDKTVLIQYPGGTTEPDYIIPNSVTSINRSAFASCTGLENVTLGNSVTSIDAGTFSGCSSLTSIIVDPDNPNYCNDEYGVLFNKDKTTLIQYPIGKAETEYTIPNSVTSLGDYAFKGCDSLESITLGNSIVSIGSYAFNGCDSLTSITIPNSVTSIGNCAFDIFDSLTSFTVLNPDLEFGLNVFGFNAADLVLYGYAGSTTEAYAAKYNYNFIPLDDPTPAYTLGDINMDGSVDIRDSLLLFQHSMMSDYYPISYPGELDFTMDGNLDVADAIRLFRYSMMPNLYPLEGAQ